jgi:hypothetical protein
MGAMIQFRVEDNGKTTVEGAVFFIPNMELAVFDYYVIKALRNGDVSPHDSNSKVFAAATGEYFCIYIPE